RLLTQAGYRWEAIPFVPITGAGVRGLLRFCLALPGALLRGIAVFRRFSPDVVLGFGGYPAFIPVLTAWLLRVPRALHEQNVQVGLANKILSRFVQQVFSVHRAEGFWTNREVRRLTNPVRRSISDVAPWQAPESGEPFVLLIMGGSQGAVSLNDAVLTVLPALAELPLYIIHQTGKLDYQRVHDAYQAVTSPRNEVHEFIDDITRIYPRVHLVVCRAGAMSAAEVSSAGRPAIYVPLRIAGGHQRQNVQHLLDCGAALVEEQSEGLGERLLADIRRLIACPGELAQMARKAKESTLAGGKTSAEQIGEALFCLARQPK
ncbi:MAG: UDP-N-acetylglucosamine--N-acetylmuramyl-(pentapeptide) pyrophosphoryl-undecaprenol N-acetylglucosamine transferase, partial [Bdellovibrionales bacterium]|nr:UDP-N-acetylglucosamine--N-acetylmuramyl-(pentapeptide) pyrophosphoryl-undecaprenol N-acetylglucosamine transferase [Bdellovibrionales bacterium]